MLDADQSSVPAIAWATRLGLSSSPLLTAPRAADVPYVLANGSAAGIIVSSESAAEQTGLEPGRAAWSANANQFVIMGRSHVIVHNWFRPKYPDVFPLDRVDQQLDRFYAHLHKTAPQSSSSIVSHSIGAFRVLRSLMGESASGHTALVCFLAVLGRLAENEAVELGIPRAAALEPLDPLEHLTQKQLDSVTKLLLGGNHPLGLRPYVTLLLRHASGSLFEEAHTEATLDPQPVFDYEGLLPNPAVPQRRRRDHAGEYFTPSDIARALVEESFHHLSAGSVPQVLRVFDPACGSGEFLREILRVVENSPLKLESVHLTGWDRSASGIALTRFSMQTEQAYFPLRMEFEIKQTDSLDPGGSWPSANLIVMNPPFASGSSIVPEARSALESVIGAPLRGRFDLAHVFLARAVRATEEQGVLGAIMPASFLSGNAGAHFRTDLLRNHKVASVVRLGSRSIFRGAKADTCMIVAARRPRLSPTTMIWTDRSRPASTVAIRRLRKIRYHRQSVPDGIRDRGFAIYETHAINAPPGGASWNPTPLEAVRLSAELGSTAKVSDYFEVRQGVLTGHNDAFLLSEEEWQSLPSGERLFFRRAVMGEDIRFGHLLSQSYVFYPYGPLRITSGEELTERLPVYLSKWLMPSQEKLSRRPRVRNWWELTEHRAWQVRPQKKMVSKYFGGLGSFAFDIDGDRVVVQGYGWLPKRGSRLVEIEAYASLAVLNSDLFMSLVSGVSQQLDGGQWNLSKRYVSILPFPALDSEAVTSELLMKLASYGEVLHHGKPIADANGHALAVRAAYGLDRDEAHVDPIENA